MRWGAGLERCRRGLTALAQHPPEDLAGRRLGDGVDELNHLDLFVGGDMAGHKGLQGLGVDGGAGLAHDEGLGQLASHIVGNADDGDICDGFVLNQQGLELGGRHLKALDLDELFEPVHDVGVAVGVDAGDVASVQPAVGVNGGGGGFGVLQIALHHLGTGDPQLALAAGGGVGAGGGVDQPGAGVREQCARRPWAHHTLWNGVADGRQLGHAVALGHRAPDPCRRRFGQLSPEGGRAGEDLANAGQVVLVDDGMLGEGQHNGGHQEQSCDAQGLGQLQHLDHVESGHRHDRGALGQPEVHQYGHAVDVEERQHREDDLVLAHVDGAFGLDEVGHKVAVGEHHPLGKAGGARRVGQRHDGLGGVDGHLARDGRTEQVGQGGPAVLRGTDEHALGDVHRITGGGGGLGEQSDGDHPLGLGILELKRQLFCAIGWVERRDGGPGQRDGMKDNRVLGQVGRHQRKRDAGADPLGLEPPCEAVDAVPELAIGEGAAGRTIDHRDLVSQAVGVAQDVLGHRALGDGDVGVGAGVDGHGGSGPGAWGRSAAMLQCGALQRTAGPLELVLTASGARGAS